MTESEQRGILDEWLRLHRGLIFKVVRVYSAADPDDLFQEILIQLWRSIPAFRGESSIGTWIYRIALNTAIRWTKKEQRHAGKESIEKAEHLLQENREATSERLNWLYEEIQKLDKIDRSLTLLLLDGFSYREMASILGISESHVGVKINRIKKQLIAKTKNYDSHGI